MRFLLSLFFCFFFPITFFTRHHEFFTSFLKKSPISGVIPPSSFFNIRIIVQNNLVCSFLKSKVNHQSLILSNPTFKNKTKHAKTQLKSEVLLGALATWQAGNSLGLSHGHGHISISTEPNLFGCDGSVGQLYCI